MEKIGYLTIEEADSFVSSHLLKDDERRTAWEGLNEEDKKALLFQSLDDIENLTYYGYKNEPEQELSFPRNGRANVPEDIKKAQIFGAIERLSHNDGYEAYIAGISEESLGTARYKYNTKSAAYESGCRPGAYKLLKKYIKALYKFC